MLKVSKKTTNRWQQRAAHSPGLKYNWLMPLRECSMNTEMWLHHKTFQTLYEKCTKCGKCRISTCNFNTKINVSSAEYSVRFIMLDHLHVSDIIRAVCWPGVSSFSELGWSWSARTRAGCATERPAAVGWTTCRPSASAGCLWRRSPGKSSLWHRFESQHRDPRPRSPGSTSVDKQRC